MESKSNPLQEVADLEKTLLLARFLVTSLA